MYFNAEAQVNVLARFHFALNPTGVLFLGKAELLLTHAKQFIPIEMKHRIFSKVENGNARDRLQAFSPVTSEVNNHVARQIRLRDLALDSSPVARIVVNANGHLVLATQKARTVFGLINKDIGRALKDLEIYYRPADLPPLIEQAYAERRTVALNAVERQFTDGQKQYFDVQVVPLADDNNTYLGASIAYIDVTSLVKVQEEWEHTNQELETTSEELQSTNEELETTNEELQSTNEELETMNEELQSTNEELHTVNEEMRQRTEELNNANGFLKSILASIRAAMVVLDSDSLVLVWNAKAEDLWGLRPEEVQGKSFMNLDIGLPVDELKRPIRACLTGEGEYQEAVVDAVNRRGRKIKCRVTCTRFVDDIKNNSGVILFMEEID